MVSKAVIVWKGSKHARPLDSIYKPYGNYKPKLNNRYSHTKVQKGIHI